MKLSEILIRPLADGEDIPYALLLDADPSEALVTAYLKYADIYVAVMMNSIVGVYVLCQVGPHRAEIKNIAVKESLQGQGVGKLLLEDATKRASEKGYRELVIGTANSSVWQLYLYQKAGFEITEIRKNFFIDNYPGLLYENGIQVKHMIVLTKRLQ